MLKFGALQANGRRLLGIGLSAENLKRLKEDKPIYFSSEQCGLSGFDILIVFGQTEESIQVDLTKVFDMAPCQRLQ